MNEFLVGILFCGIWRSWLGGRKGIWPGKYWMVRCWRGYLSGARCRLACGPAEGWNFHYISWILYYNLSAASTEYKMMMHCLNKLLQFVVIFQRLSLKYLIIGWFSSQSLYFVCYNAVPSMLWHCWLGGRKGIWPVKNWVMGCWHSYLSGARCRLAYGPADATATHCLLLQ